MKLPVTRELGSKPMLREFLLVPNVISLLRIAVVPFIWFVITTPLEQRFIIVFILICLALITDAFDGYLARKLHLQSRLGLILDPISDKIVSLNLMGILYIYSDFPFWMIAFVVIRDIIILLANFIFVKRHNEVFRSDFFGRWAFIFLSFTIISYTARWLFPTIPRFYLIVMLIVVLFFMVASSLQYLVNFLKSWHSA